MSLSPWWPRLSRRRSLVYWFLNWVGAAPSHGLGLHFLMCGDELGFEFVEMRGFFLREVGSLGGIVDDVEELEAKELAVLDFGEMGFVPT